MGNNPFIAIIELIPELIEALQTGDFSMLMRGGVLTFIYLLIMIIPLIGMLLSLVFGVVIYLLEAIPLYKLAKKNGRKLAWLAWIPVVGAYCRLYVLADIAGEKPFSMLNDKIRIAKRPMSFLVFLGVDLFGGLLINIALSIISIIPVIGWIIGLFGSLLHLVPAVFLAIMEYRYLYDAVNVFKGDRESNRKTSIIVTVLDALVTQGLARTIYLYTLLKYDPIPEPVVSEEAFTPEIPV